MHLRAQVLDARKRFLPEQAAKCARRFWPLEVASNRSGRIDEQDPACSKSGGCEFDAAGWPVANGRDAVARTIRRYVRDEVAVGNPSSPAALIPLDHCPFEHERPAEE